MKYISKHTFLLILLVLTLSRCNESQVNLTPIDENLVFTTQTDGATLIENITLNDGSIDNILDNASCIQLQLPIDVTINNQLLTVQSQNDIDDILNEFLKNPFLEFNVGFQFPISVISAEHSVIKINSQSELETLRNSCVENGNDLDIECIDFRYPLSVATYDRLNQIADVTTVNRDSDLFFLLRESSDEDLLGFEFPLTMITTEGNEFMVSDNSRLFDLIENSVNICDENDRIYAQETPPPTQSLSLKLTDAPFPLDLVDQVNVNLTKIDIRTGPENNAVQYITLFEQDLVVDMLTLTNGNTLDLSTTELPVGSYPSMRMFVNDGFVLMKDGQVFDLKVPSGSQSGIKINFRESLVLDENETKEVLLDFDVSKSLVARGNINSPNGIRGFNFKPVINASVLSQSGTLEGTVRDRLSNELLENAQISVIAADTVFTSSFTNPSGAFKVLGVPEGNYELLVELKDYMPESIEMVQVRIAEETVVEIQLERE